MSAPQRAVKLYIELDANTRDEMVQALQTVALECSMGKLTHGVSAGPSASWVYHYSESDHPTKDEYFAALDAWLEEKRVEHGVGKVEAVIVPSTGPGELERR